MMRHSAVQVPALSGVAESAILFVHGLGDSGNGWSFFAPLVQRSGIVKSARNTRFIFPNAPERPITVNGGMMMPAWFDIHTLGDRRGKQDTEGFLESCTLLKSYIKKEMEENKIPPEKIIIGGFSQGAAVALATLALLDFKIGGCVALAGFLPIPEKMKEIFQKDNCPNLTTPIFQGHGDSDPVIAHAYALETSETYKLLGFSNYKFQTYRGLGHSTNERETQDVLHFISLILD